MSVAKTIEITASSEIGFEDAIKVGIARAAETVHHITGAWVQDQEVEVKDGNITAYRVRLKLTFVLK